MKSILKKTALAAMFATLPLSQAAAEDVLIG